MIITEGKEQFSELAQTGRQIPGNGYCIQAQEKFSNEWWKSSFCAQEVVCREKRTVTLEGVPVHSRGWTA
jgi:hypothetical protein